MYLIVKIDRMKKRTILLSMLFIAVFAQIVVATSPSKSVDASHQWPAIIEEFGLETIDEAPAGIVPSEVRSPQELRQLLLGRVPQHIVFDVNASDLLDPTAQAISGVRTACFTLPLHESDSSQ